MVCAKAVRELGVVVLLNVALFSLVVGGTATSDSGDMVGFYKSSGSAIILFAKSVCTLLISFHF